MSYLMYIRSRLFLEGAKDPQLQQKFVGLAISCTSSLSDGLKTWVPDNEDAFRYKGEVDYGLCQELVAEPLSPAPDVAFASYDRLQPGCQIC